MTKCERHPEVPKEPRYVRDPFALVITVYECRLCDDENAEIFRRNRQATTPASTTTPATS